LEFNIDKEFWNTDTQNQSSLFKKSVFVGTQLSVKAKDLELKMGQ
jgi:hypothetical protein